MQNFKECGMQNVECRNEIARDRGGRSRTIRHSSFVILLIIFCALFSANGFGQSANRWLFVFDTSHSMRDRAKGVEDVTLDLLATGMHGNIHPGDTIGIWTFNDKLHAGEVPLQTWSQDAAPTIARNILVFMRKQSYENSANLDAVVPGVLNLVKSSDVITVILISDNGSPLNGTPFDAKLNTYYKENYRQQKKEKMPFITVFRGMGGNLTTNTVTMAPWPVDIPTVPVPQVAAQKPKAPVPSLIVIGKKPETVAPPAPLPTAVPMPVVEKSSLPVTPVEPTVGANPTPVMPVMTSNVIQAVAPTITAVTTPAPPANPTEAAAPAAVPPAVPTEVATPPATTEPKVIAPATVSTTPKVTPPPPVSAEPKSKVAAIQPAPAVTPLPYPDVTPKIEPAASNSAISAEQSGVETAVTVPSQNLFSTRNIVIASVGLVVIVGGLIVLSARRSRAPRASLITQSFERKK